MVGGWISHEAMELMEEAGWTFKTEGMKINRNLPNNVDSFLKISQSYTREYRIEKLCGITTDNIANAMEWLEKHEDHVFSKEYGGSSWNRQAKFIMMKEPMTLYNPNRRYRGKTSTVRRNQFVLDMEDLHELVEEHLEVREKSINKKQFEEQLKIITDYRKQLKESKNKIKDYFMTKEEIAEKALQTFDVYRRGVSCNTHGRWGFGLDYMGLYIDDGKLRTFDEEYIKKAYLKKFSGVTIKSLVEQIPALVEEYMRQQEIYYQASKDWLEVMNKLYGGIYAVYEQHYFSEHADVERWYSNRPNSNPRGSGIMQQTYICNIGRE